MMAFITADSIQEFFGCLDHAFPGMKRTVKMHLHVLEHHVSEWVDMYNAGFGLMGEQGTEAQYNHFNKLYRTYGSMANKVQRLKCIMQEHSECVKSLRPEKLSRKRKRNRKVCDFLPRICVSVYPYK